MGRKKTTNTAGMSKIGDDGLFGEEGREYEYQTYSPDNFEEQNEVVVGTETSKELVESAGFIHVEKTETITETETLFHPEADNSVITITTPISEHSEKKLTYIPNEVANNVIGTTKTVSGGKDIVTPVWSPSQVYREKSITTSYNKPGVSSKISKNNNMFLGGIKIVAELVKVYYAHKYK